MRKYSIIFFIIICILVSGFIGISYAKYQKQLTGNSVAISSYDFVSLTVAMSEETDEDNTFTFTITNDNDYSVTYQIKEEDDLYEVEYSGTTNNYVTIAANSTETITVVINGRDDVVYEDMLTDASGNLYKTINIVIESINPYNSNATTIATEQTIYLDKSVKNQIINLAGEITHYEEGATFTTISSSSEAALCSIEDPVSGEIIHFYRGSVTNNYVYFAGLTWRILRINSDGSLRLILDSSISTSSYASANIPSEKTIENAIELINWQNSNVYSALHTWYSESIEPDYGDYVVLTDYVFDTSYQLITSSATSGACYYFETYLRAGADGNAYQPTFSYTDESLVQDYVGLITSDEIVYAGAHWKTANTSYFLYNSAITTDCWTMSPSFWDYSSHYKAGLIVLGTNGRIYDWPNSGNTLTGSLGIRPVISIRGDLEMSGSGTADEPYQYN